MYIKPKYRLCTSQAPNFFQTYGRGGTLKVDTGEFSLTVDTADRTNMLKVLDIGGHSASDRSLYSIVLAQNWNGLSSPALSIPVRNTNIPPGYCGDFSYEESTAPPVVAVDAYNAYALNEGRNRPTLDGTANTFFGGTGTSADPYTVIMRPYCDELIFDWNSNYPATSGTTHRIHYRIDLSTTRGYYATFTHIDVPDSDAIQTLTIEELGVLSSSPQVITPANTDPATDTVHTTSYPTPGTMPVMIDSLTMVHANSAGGKPLGGSRRLRIGITSP